MVGARDGATNDLTRAAKAGTQTKVWGRLSFRWCVHTYVH
jgi:hypothetical protein